MSKSQNKNPSRKTKKEINNAVNFVYEWLSDRYVKGKMSEGEYLSCVEKLKNMKVFLMDNDSDRLISALEKGEVHLSSEVSKDYSTEQVMNMFLSEPKEKARLGYNAGELLVEPAVFIDVDKINESVKKGTIPSFEGIVVHEITHAMGLEEHEKAIDEALRGRYSSRDDVLVGKVKRSKIEVEIIPDNGISYEHKEKENETEGESGTKAKVSNDVILNEGVTYSSYWDSSNEVYARIMQMRIDMQLDPKKTYTIKDVKKLRKKAEEADKWGEPKRGYEIFERYSDEQILHFLNDTAYIDVKDAMKQDASDAQLRILLAETKHNLQSREDSKSEKNVTVRQINPAILEASRNQRA